MGAPGTTKGDWSDGRTIEVRGEVISISWLCATEPGGRRDVEARANMIQMAASGDLYDALARAVEEIEELRRYANNHGGMIDEERCDYGRAALSSARILTDEGDAR